MLPVLNLEDFPNAVVDVFIELPQTDAGTRCAGICAAAIALADAGLSMKDLVSSVSVGKVGTMTAVDLNYAEESYEEGDVADVPVAFIPRTGQISLLQMDGLIDKESLKKALEMIPRLREEFWKDVKVPGDVNNFNPEIEKAGRIADFFELAELMVQDALHREESCGGHFREEYQTEEGEAKRNDEQFSYVAAWEFKGVGQKEDLHKEPLTFEYVKIAQRSYK